MEDEPFFNRYANIYYNPKNPANLKDFENRQLFLGAAARVVPDFADSLFKATHPLILDWIKEHGSLPTQKDPPRWTEFYTGIFEAIRDWAKTFSIDTEWVIAEAYDASIVALTYAEKGIDPMKALGTWRRSRHGSARKPFDLPAWDPYRESEDAYIVRANTAWELVRAQHVEETKSRLEVEGAAPMPAKRRRRPDPDVRFEWAALNWCAGKSINELADQYLEDTEAIRIAVARVLKDLGFGRPT